MHKPLWFAISERSYVNLNEVTSVHFDTDTATLYAASGNRLMIHDKKRIQKLHALIVNEAVG